jgi:putative ABC transport system permease protein
VRAWKIALLALGGLRRAPLRVLLTTLGVTIASGALVSMIAFALGLQRQIEAPMQLLSLLNDIRVSPKEGDQAKDAPRLDDAAVDRLAHLPGVASAFPDIRVRGIEVHHGDHVETCLAVAMPREASLFSTAHEILIAGHFFSEGPDREIILGAELVRALGFASAEASLGTVLKLEASGLSPDQGKSFTFERKELSVTVVGVYELPLIVPGLARRGVIVPVDLMKEVPGVQLESALERLKAGDSAASARYNSVTVRVHDPADVRGVDEQIKQMGFQTRTMLSRFQQMQTFFIFLRVLLACIGTVALVVAALGIVNTLLMAVLERYQEIGICKAIGASDGDFVVLFLTEAGIIGLMGGLGGLLLGRLVSYALEIAINAYARSQGATEPLGVFLFPLWLLAGSTLFAMVISVLAGVYPALHAARVDPIRALRRA